MKRLGQFAALDSADVKGYKKLKRARLSEPEVRNLVHKVLDEFAICHPHGWPTIVERAIDWLLADDTWKTPEDTYRGGKLLDDCIDTTIALATALSYANRSAHVWQDPNDEEDGHIIGPGYPEEDEYWHPALEGN